MKRMMTFLLSLLFLLLPAGACSRPADSHERLAKMELRRATVSPSFPKAAVTTTPAETETVKETEAAPPFGPQQPFSEKALLHYLASEFNRPSILGERYAKVEPLYYELYRTPEEMLERAAETERGKLEALLDKEGWAEKTLGLYLVLDLQNKREELRRRQGFALDGTSDLFVLLVPQGSAYRLARYADLY